MIRKFKKKPIVIQALQYSGSDDSYNELKQFINKKVGIWRIQSGVKIRTLEGDMTVSINDWVIKGVRGEFYPCKPDIFKEIYIELENET